MERVLHSPKTSYSQSGEDMIIRHVFNALGVSNPSYIDIGAHHPFELSNTAWFYEHGSRGINIEANPLLMAPFLEYRKHDVNLNVGIMEEAGEMDFFIIDPPSLSTFSESEAKRIEREYGYAIREIKKIPVTTVQQVFERHLPGGHLPDFLSIDVEGFEGPIFRSIDFDTWSPTVICCETVVFEMKGIAGKNSEIVDFLTARGYMVYADTGINTIFVKKSTWENR
ncbi:hypothetical protein AL013_00460 [Mariprofundus ferrooxydans]|nr:hypothetical protein AL013_00460 [Mariprofundus ferrooxydans]